MKKIVIVCVLSMFALLPLRAQQIKGYLALGGNLSQVDGDKIYGFKKFGFNGGPGAIISFNEKWSLHFETLFSQKGSFQAGYTDPPITNQYKLNLNYAEVPVYVNFYDMKGGMSFGTGFSWGQLVSFSETQHDQKIDYANSYITEPGTSDLSWLVNFYVPLKERLKINFRYSYSVRSYRNREFSRGDFREQYNNVITIRLMYIFNEKSVQIPQ